MDLNEIVHAVRALDGVLVLAPDVGSDFPEISWGDFFFYYAPDGEVPLNTQPFATIVTKDYPDDDSLGPRRGGALAREHPCRPGEARRADRRRLDRSR